VQHGGGGVELPGTGTESSTEEWRELCLSWFVLQAREEGSAAVGKLFAVSELALVSKSLSFNFFNSEGFLTLEEEEENSRIT